MKDVYLINAHTLKQVNCFCKQFVFLKTKASRCCLVLLTALFFKQLSAQPAITSFSPLSGLPGSTVTINGSNFASSPSDNIVSIGGAHAHVLTASPNKLTVQVPRGITYKPISITVNNLTGFSAVPYITTYKTGNVITPGTFSTPVNFYMETRANVDPGLTIEDLDGDGKPDVFATGRFSTFDDFYAAYKNTSTPGTVSFAMPVIESLPFSYNRDLLPLADINGDGKKDIISWNIDHLDIVLNSSSKGAISFTDKLTIPMNYSAVNYTGVEDLNADGKLDLYGFDYDHLDSMSFAQNTSSGGQISFAQPILLPYSVYFNPLKLADFNGDQKADILSTVHNAISISINTSKNGILSFDNPENILPANFAIFQGIADINKDGKPDIIITHPGYQKDSLYFLLNTSTSGNLSFSAPVGFHLGFGSLDFNIVDIDGDGQPDITGYDINSRNYIIAKNTSTAKRMSFAPPVIFPSIKSSGLAYSDFDGDGRQDLAYCVKDYLSFVSVLRNQTDTAKGAPFITSFSPIAAMQNDTLTIDGDNLSGATNITLGGTPVQSFKVVSNTRISVVVDRGTTGDLKVTTRKGVASKAAFNYLTDTTVKLISTVSDVLCSGKIARVKAVVSNAYSGVKYTWYRNGKIDPISGNIYTSHSLNDGDSVWCVVSFTGLPADKALKSEVIKFRVNLSQTPKLRIQSSKGTLICKGTSVTFKAIVNNGDFKPVYQWQKNNVVVGDTTDTYLDNSLQNSDIIRCTIVRAQQCTVLPATASLQMNVDNSRPSAPIAIIGPDEVSPSQANIIFSVPHPTETRTFKWQIPSGASFVSGNGTDSVTVNWSSTTAKISVGAGNACGVSPVVTKTVRVTSTNTRIAQKEISKEVSNETESVVIYPNPANSKTTVVFNGTNNKYTAMQLRDVTGKLLLYKKVQTVKGAMRTEINTAIYAPGIYYVVLIDQNNKSTTRRLMIAK